MHFYVLAMPFSSVAAMSSESTYSESTYSTTTDSAHMYTPLRLSRCVCRRMDRIIKQKYQVPNRHPTAMNHVEQDNKTADVTSHQGLTNKLWPTTHNIINGQYPHMLHNCPFICRNRTLNVPYSSFDIGQSSPHPPCMAIHNNGHRGGQHQPIVHVYARHAYVARTHTKHTHTH